jgi:hypothetical protein
MALLMITWDLPPAEQRQVYDAKGPEWVEMVMRQPGVIQFRGFRNTFHTTPMAMIHLEFDSLASCMTFIESDDYAVLSAEMYATGVTNVSVQLWKPSPTVPRSLRPSGG